MSVVLTVVGKYDGKDLKRAEEQLKKLTREAQRASSPFTRVGESFQKVGDKAVSAGKTLSTNLTLPIAGLGFAAFRVGAEFETSMNQIQAALGASGTEMQNLEALAKRMGKETVFSANDAADAMLNLAKAGLSEAQISAGALEASMALAATEGLDLGYTAEVVSNAMGAFGLKAQDAARIADVLAGASTASTAGVADLSQALSQVSAVAAGAGFSINETTGALALLASNGIKGSDAGTSLKTMLLRLNPATDEAAALMRKLGIDFTNADGSFKSLSEVSGILNDRLGGMADSQRLAALQTIFGTDAMRAANILTTRGAEGLDKYTAATKDKNAAEKLSEARTKGGAAAMEQMKGSLENAALAIYEAMAPAVTQVAGFIQSLADKFAAMPKGAQTFIVAAAGVAAALGPVLFLVGNITRAIGLMSQAVAFAGMVQKAFAGETVASAAAQRIAAAATKVWTGIQAAFNAVMAANPIVLLGLAIAALVAGVIIAYKKFDWFRDLVDKVGRAIKGAFVAAWNAAKTAVGAVVNFFVSAWTRLKDAGSTLVNAYAAYLRFWRDLFTTALGWVTTGVGKIVDFFRDIPSKLAQLPARMLTVGKNIVEGIWKGISGAAGWLWDKIKGFADGIVDGIKGFFGIASPSKRTAEIGRQVAEGLAVGIEGTTAKVRYSTTTMGRKIVDALGMEFQKGKGKSKQLAEALASAMVDAAAERLDALKDSAQKVIDFATGIADSLRATASVANFDPDQYQSAVDDLASIDARIVEQKERVTAALKALDKERAQGAKASADDIIEAQTRVADEQDALARLAKDRTRAEARVSSTAVTSGNIIAEMRARVAQVQKFGQNLAALKALNLNNASLQEIIAAGPTVGNAIAEALLKEGSAAIGEVNTLESQLSSAAGGIGDLGAQSQYGQSVGQAEAIVNSTITFGQGSIVVTVGAGADSATVSAVTDAVMVAVQEAATNAAQSTLADVAKAIKTGKRGTPPKPTPKPKPKPAPTARGGSAKFR